ncbi:GNAT family N-acetyltransferase [Plectonema cf. radiosum LEGE 06105]|uniref:GNAT family N-acetyltransferase n=1 Tax=Plectonema cf. radiosum LEGE 06105 TaxID=945769 RepID=A0A8J7F655_9CYAN|nr:GNAT family N-acetyltransferase [Plectonema radiosum]MBE9216090.1 GNAT family N-acetyltransferase [Plectonema cf. radiosum LEGE 06105]
MKNKPIKITPIKQHQIDQVKQVVITVSLEIWNGLLNEDDLKRYDSMSDIDNVQFHYFENNGTFLVLLEESRVVGTGAIRKLDDEICELKRMWFLKEYRGKGYGWQMVQILFNFAKQAGYQKVRLDLAREEHQTQAVKFYRKLGFYPIERYNDK